MRTWRGWSWRGLLFGAVLLAGAAAASAQESEVPLDRFSVQSYQVAPGPADAFAVESPAVGTHLTPTVGLSLDYAHEPFVVVRCPSQDDCDLGSREAALVRSLSTAQFYASFGLFDRFQVALMVPLGLRTGEGFAFSRSGQRYELPGGSFFGLGDPRLMVKGRIWRQGAEGLAVGASAFVTGPIGQQIGEEAFVADPGVSFGAQLLGSWRRGPLTALLNVGGTWRDRAQLFSTEIGPRLTYGLAASYRFPTRLEVLLEAQGSASLRAQLDENPLEARLGARYALGQLTFGLAAGGGLLAGAGTPLFRAVATVRWTPAHQDTDGDGIVDADDACPAEPEDMDGVEDGDGCPEGDTDRDGIEDEQDRCPDQAEDFDEFEDEDGCPDEDNDGDGIRDGFDSCPNEPEDQDGDRDEDGCPDHDTDRDGIQDSEDRCPRRPEDVDGFADLDGCPERDVDLDGIDDTEDECPEEPETYNGVDDQDGCPEPDADGDGVSDARDRCPDEAETYNGKRDEDGCPDGAALLERAEEGLRILAPIRFRGGQPAPGLRKALEAAAVVLRRERHRRKVEVVLVLPGESAERAAARAEALAAVLRRQGVERDRLVVAPLVEGEGDPSLMLRFARVVPGEGDDWVPPSPDEEGEASGEEAAPAEEAGEAAAEE